MSGAGWAIMAGLLFLAGFGGFGIGQWRREAYDKARWIEGYATALINHGMDEDEEWNGDEQEPVRTVRTADVVRPDPSGVAGDADRRALSPAVRADLGSAHPVAAEVARGLPDEDTYRARLAAAVGPDPAPWLAALIAPEPPVQPGPPPELAWLERLLYKGAMSTAWCTSVIESLVPSFAEDVAATDRWIARWGEEARWELIGCRQWPLPGMVTA